MEMTRSIMKHMAVPNYLWGEAVRHSTYLLNRVATRAIKDRTPYEMFREKKPNIGHLRVFGCIGYAKVDSKFLRKLDDRSRMLVHLGTEPGSKAYRMFDPNTQKIKVSINVVFNEAKGWNWCSSFRYQNRTGDFKVVIGTFGNHGLPETELVESKTEMKAIDEEHTSETNEEEGDDSEEEEENRAQS